MLLQNFPLSYFYLGLDLNFFFKKNPKYLKNILLHLINFIFLSLLTILCTILMYIKTCNVFLVIFSKRGNHIVHNLVNLREA